MLLLFGIFCASIQFFGDIYPSSVKYVIGILIGIAMNLYIALGRMGILMMLILPTYAPGICFHYLHLLRFLSSVSYNFPSTGLLHPWLN